MQAIPHTPVGREEKSRYYTISSRKWICERALLTVKELTLAPGEEVPWHHHSAVFDLFYCLQGTLVIELADVFTGDRLDDIVLAVGESVRVEIGTAHHPYNPGPGAARVVIIQGDGEYDYLAYQHGQ